MVSDGAEIAMSPQASLLPCKTRLHLQHGPIDLVIGADGEREAAFSAATARFETILSELMQDIERLRTPVCELNARTKGETAKRMVQAVRKHQGIFVTPMAAVAGAVADTVLRSMCKAAQVRRAYVNNGGDIALFLKPGEIYSAQIAGVSGQEHGRIRLTHADGIGGIATSGRGGRSLSLGLADSVTTLASTAADADVAATLIANAVDIPDHPGIKRGPATDLCDTSDLGAQPVVVHCPALKESDVQCALGAGLKRASAFQSRGYIDSAFLSLQGKIATTHPARNAISKDPAYARCQTA